MGRLDGKVALISGAARGQGEAEARRFVAEGASVLLGDILDDEGEAVARELGDAARYVRLDVTSEDAWEAAVTVAEEAFGHLDVLVNNAGIIHFAPLTRTSLDDYLKVIMVNQVGTFLGMRAAVKPMERAGGGSIVNISSTGGMWGLPMMAAYSSSKFAVRGLTKVGACELGRKGIRVNSVHPGGIDTAMTRGPGVVDLEQSVYYQRLPLRRMGTVDEVANLVLFLASDESAYCTGGEFLVEGGALAGDTSMFDTT